MFFSNIYLSGYALAWITILVIFLIKNRKVGIGGILIITYSISALTSILFYNGLGTLTNGEDIDWIPLLYLFICLNICMLPIYIHSNELVKLRLQTTDKGLSFIVFFMQVVSPFVIEAFIEILYIAYDTNSNSMGAIYESSNDVVGTKLSFLGRKTMIICRWFNFIWPIIFFYLYSKGKSYYKYAWIALLAFSTSILEAYAGASRVGIVRNLMYFFIVFILFKSSLPSNIKNKIVKIFTIGVPVMAIFLWLITIARFKYGGANNSFDVITWITLYSGEAPIRFCQYAWDVNGTMDGDNTFAILKELLGLNPITDIEQRRDFWEARLGIPTRIFYSWIGDVYFDLGKFSTLLYSLVFAGILEFFIRKIAKKMVYTLSSITVLSIIILTFMFGIMYYPFKTYISQILLIPNLIFLMFYNYFSKSRSVV